jgi:hypothetical protein
MVAGYVIAECHSAETAANPGVHRDRDRAFSRLFVTSQSIYAFIGRLTCRYSPRSA